MLLILASLGGTLIASAPPPTCDISRQPASAPDEVVAMVEIPAGGQVKYEFDPTTGRMEVDRFLSMPVAYPVNYGILPCTTADDGDPLDVLVLTRIPVDSGALLRVRPIGVLRMLDDGEEDHKLIAVPTSAVDPGYDDVAGVDHLSAALRDRIEAFFVVYKELPEPGGRVEVGPWQGVDAARRLIVAGSAAN